MVQALEPVQRRAPGRVPPHNLEAEESLLGAMLLSRDAISAATEAHVDASDFYKPAHGHVYEAVMSLYGQGEPVDPVTVADELRRAELLDALGGRQTLLRLQTGTPASANASHYATIVNELALLRRLIAVAGDIAEMGYDDSSEVAETLDRAESLVFEVAERRVSESMVGVSVALQDTLDQLEALYGSEGEITGVQTGYLDLDHLLLGLQPSNLIVVAARPGMGKCVAWDTLVIDAATGDLRTAEQMHRLGQAGTSGQVLALGNDWKLAPATPSAFIDDGVKPVFRVVTRSGRVIRTTASHPFLTPVGWRPLADVAVNTRVAVPRTIPVFGNEAMPEAEIVLLAFLIGDGCLRNTSPRMTTASPAVLAELTEQCEQLGASVRPNGKYSYRLVTRRGAPNPVIDSCRRHGVWGKTAHDKRIPEAIFRLSRENLALFLNRLFATDGSAWVDKNGFTQIEYCSVSEPLARAVQHLLLRFGVLSRLRSRKIAYKGSRRPAWSVGITTHESLLTFCDQIGILGREPAVERVRAAVSGRYANPNLDTLPIETWQRILAVKGQRSWASISSAAGRARNHNWHVGRRSPGRGIVEELSTVLESPDLQKIASSDIYWDEVVSIDFDGNEQVYDLTVPELHNFVAGDVVVHNSAFALGAAANVAMTARRPVMFFSMEMGVLELTKRLLAGEARVDARRLQTGDIPEADWGRLSHAVGRLAETPLYIDDNPHCTVMEMRAKARRAKARHGDLGLIVVDYLQLMTPSTSKRMENRQVEVAEISRGLKILARELDCPVMALSQLNRQLEYRQDKRPMLADLRESGGLEQDSDVVLFIYRDEVYNPESEQRGSAEIIVSKHRNGPTGVTRLAFLDHFVKFANMARE
ncbi:MAG: replicative DNA helicase [Acidimicrobiia bacterium]